MIHLTFHKKFKKHIAKLTPKQRRQIEERLLLFISTPFAHDLNNHALGEVSRGYRSINITGDMRAIYEPISKNEVFFVEIGTHSELY
jgi:addiction module RelE/StbE family toxin